MFDSPHVTNTRQCDMATDHAVNVRWCENRLFSGATLVMKTEKEYRLEEASHVPMCPTSRAAPSKPWRTLPLSHFQYNRALFFAGHPPMATKNMPLTRTAIMGNKSPSLSNQSVWLPPYKSKMAPLTATRGQLFITPMPTRVYVGLKNKLLVERMTSTALLTSILVRKI